MEDLWTICQQKFGEVDEIEFSKFLKTFTEIRVKTWSFTLCDLAEVRVLGCKIRFHLQKHWSYGYSI